MAAIPHFEFYFTDRFANFLRTITQQIPDCRSRRYDSNELRKCQVTTYCYEVISEKRAHVKSMGIFVLRLHKIWTFSITWESMGINFRNHFNR